jgi:hypothetical protein
MVMLHSKAKPLNAKHIKIDGAMQRHHYPTMSWNEIQVDNETVWKHWNLVSSIKYKSDPSFESAKKSTENKHYSFKDAPWFESVVQLEASMSYHYRLAIEAWKNTISDGAITPSQSLHLNQGLFDLTANMLRMREYVRQYLRAANNDTDDNAREFRALMYDWDDVVCEFKFVCWRIPNIQFLD